jgi:hypothetical protein
MKAITSERLVETASSDANRPTLLYPLKPIGIGTDQCESISSFISRLALAHHVAIIHLIRYLDALIGRERADYNHLQNMLADSNDTLVPSLIVATGRSELAECRLSSLASVMRFRKRPKIAKLRHCPVCLSEFRFPESWNRLIWEVDWVEACPHHNVLLAESICGHTREQWVCPGSRIFRPGVCRFCGSVGFSCSRSRPRRASTAQQWTAVEVGKLIAAESGGEKFTVEALCEGLNAAIKLGWEGNLSATERTLRLNAGYLSAVLHSWQLIDVKVLFALCSHVRLEPISVLRGWPMPISATVQPLQVNLSRPRKSRSKCELEFDLKNVLASNPDISFLALSHELGAADQRLKKIFPELATDMHKDRELLVKKRRWRRLLRIGRKLLVIKRQLAAEGLPFNTSRVHARTGILIRPELIEARLFEWVRQR